MGNVSKSKAQDCAFHCSDATPILTTPPSPSNPSSAPPPPPPELVREESEELQLQSAMQQHASYTVLSNEIEGEYLCADN